MNLDQFARKMRELLLANQYKDGFDSDRRSVGGPGPVPPVTGEDRGPGWRRMTPEAVMRLVEQAARDLRDAFIEGKGGEGSSPGEHPADEHMAFVVEKAGDLAVLAYMIADKVADDGDNAYLREHLTLAEQIAAAFLALVPEIWVCESCNRAEAFDESGPWHPCACGCLRFCRTDGTSERRQVPPSGATQSGGSG